MDLISYLLVTIISLMAVWWFCRHDPKIPPCPVTPLPLFGHLLYMDKNPRKQFKQWRKQCGDIYSLYLGQSLVIVLNGYDLIKEALVKNDDKCSDRPFIFFDAATGQTGLGLVFSSGDLWKEHRTITMNIFRALGVGKNLIVEEVTEMALINNEMLASLKGEPADIKDIITTNIGNIICSIIFGHRFNNDDEVFITAMKNITENVKDGDGSNFANYFHFWSYIPGDLFKAKKMKANAQRVLSSFIQPEIQRIGYDEYDENKKDSFIACYMHEKNRKLKAGEPTTMSDDNLKKTVLDLFGAGMETSSTTLLWCMLYFLHHPDIQEKIFHEIQTVVGLERLPKMADKIELPYLNAVIQEVLRISSIVPLNIFHMCNEDLILGGYTIPKGTTLAPSLDSILFDKKTWGEDANLFKPERFLNEKGKVKHPEEFVPFSLGKRVCVGESLTRVELFIFLSFMVQRFKFLPANPGPLPSLNAVFGISARPEEFKVRVEERKKDESLN